MSHDTISPRRPAHQVVLLVAGALSVLLIVVSAVLQRITLSNYYQIVPGQASPVGPLVHVSGLPSQSRSGGIYLVDVYVTPLTAWQWLTARWHQPNEIFQLSDYLAPGVPASEFDAQGYLDMQTSKNAAAISAWRAVGWTVPVRAVGADIYTVLGNSPAWRAGLRVGDRIIGASGHAVTSSCDVIRDVHPLSPGSLVTLTVTSARISAVGAITYGPAHTVALRTTALGNWAGRSDCPGTSLVARSSLGVQLNDAISAHFPADITVRTDNIGGPSAGLAMSLAMIDHLSATALTGHARVAVTGTIDITGAVGEVGGVAEKTAAAIAAHATDFFVPASQLDEATAVAGHSLHVWPVTTLRQALADLRIISGHAVSPLTQPHLTARKP